MDDILQVLGGIIPFIVSDVQDKSWTAEYIEGFRSYLSKLDPSLARYRHHLGLTMDIHKLQARYEHEIALLSFLTAILCYNFKSLPLSEESNWPNYEENSPYNWYTIPSGYSCKAQQVSQILKRSDFPQAMISEALGQIIARANQRFLGEFYTPLPIARHLIDLSGFRTTELVRGQRLVDPACGGGIILSEIARRTVSENGNLSADKVLNSLANNLWGFDIQPFAIMMTKSLLLYTCSSLLEQVPIESWPSFDGIQLRDPLLQRDCWHNSQRKFHYIIGNPPFAPVKKKHLDYAQYYKEILYGRPNLYQMFLWWSVKSARNEAKISFLLPQSILSGTYSKRLRKKLFEAARLVAVTRIVEGKGVVDNADQQMMAVCLRTGLQQFEENSEPTVTIRTTRNGNDTAGSLSKRIEHSKVIRQIDDSLIVWSISDEHLDYDILGILDEECDRIAEVEELDCGTGEYVWNRNKNLLQKEQVEGAVPLVSAASIKPYKFEFPYTGSHASKARQFSLVTDNMKSILHNELTVLVQRTTPRKFGRRLVAAVTNERFFHHYPEYFVENHINYISCDYDLLYGLMGWLNSDLINFVFQLNSGTTQVSLFEIGILPFDKDIVESISLLAASVAGANSNEKHDIEDLNQCIFDKIGFNSRHRERIREVLRVQKGKQK